MNFHNENKNKHNIFLTRTEANITTTTTTAMMTTTMLEDELTAMFRSEAAYTLALCALQSSPLDYIMCAKKREG